MIEELDKKIEDATSDQTSVDLESLKIELENTKREKEEYLDGWKRAKAELINFKNEEMDRLKEVSRFAGEDIVRDLIVVLDGFDLAITALSKDLDSATGKGVYMIRSQFEDALKKRGLERIISPVGHPFDPSLHEAVASMESDLAADTVIDEVERGYILNGRVIRPARVVVSKGRTSLEETA